MADLRLFAVPEVEPAAAAPKLSRDAALTARNRAKLAAGRHPATGRPLLDPEWGYTCRDCANCYGSGHNLRTYWKCRRHVRGHTGGAASDIRVSWPACVLLRIDGATS